MTGLYIHIPFCISKCPYCDFLSYPVGKKQDFGEYVSALVRELRLWQSKGIKVDTLYFGGGTPSLLPLDTIESILLGAQKVFDITSDAEITLEANPGTVSPEYFKGLAALGVNRLSLGVQSLDDGLLKNIGRIHNSRQALEALEAAEKCFGNISADIMSGLPGQSINQLSATLEELSGHSISHISCYDLTLYEGTPFCKAYDEGRLLLPDEDSASDMLFCLWDRAKALGFEHYELSSFARDKRYSRHNLHYWRGNEYIGIGCGAAGFFGGKRYRHREKVKEYIEDVNNGLSMPVIDELPTREELAVEGLMLSMRTKWGANIGALSPSLSEAKKAEWDCAVKNVLENGLCAYEGGRLVPTEKGWKIENSWLCDFM